MTAAIFLIDFIWLLIAWGGWASKATLDTLIDPTKFSSEDDIPWNKIKGIHGFALFTSILVLLVKVFLDCIS